MASTKELLVGTSLGAIAARVRDSFELFVTAHLTPDQLGIVANDQLATTLMTSMCRSRRTFVDVGAHIGSVSAEVLRRDRSVRVVAIEAVPRKAASLRQRLPAVEVHECAVGPSEGSATFFVHRTESAYSSLGRPLKGSASELDAVDVRVRPLDLLVTQADVDVLKIDVEGAELGVLLGASALVERCRPTIVFESSGPHDNGLGYDGDALWTWLHERSYGIYVPNRVAHHGEPLSREGFAESHVHPRRTTNYIAIAAERRAEIRDRARSLLAA